MLFDFTTLAAHDRYKLMVSTIVPRPIAWVVTCDQAGRLNAAPYSFFNAFANEPPVVVIGIGGRRPGDVKDTGQNIRETGEFVVNLVSEETAQAMNVTAIDFPPEVDELFQAGLETAASTRIRPPRIAASPVAFECERMMAIELHHDRTLVVGRVVAMHVHDAAVIDPRALLHRHAQPAPDRPDARRRQLPAHDRRLRDAAHQAGRLGAAG